MATENTMTAREEVENVWELTAQCDGSYRHYARGTVLIQDRHGHWLDFKSWEDALDFTRKWLKEIRDRDAEIKLINENLESVQHSIMLESIWEEHPDDKEDVRKEAIYKRVIERLTAQRDALTTRMRIEQP